MVVEARTRALEPSISQDAHFALPRYNMRMIDRLRSSRRNMLAVLAMASLLCASAIEHARAQDVFSDIFGGLFGGGRHHYAPREAQPYYRYEPRVRRLMPHRNYGAPAYWHGERTKKAKARKDETTPENSFVVMVVGDSLAQMLANGLEEAFEEKAEIIIRHKEKESSGLVRDDFYDWPKSISEQLAGADKIDTAVVMIGSNDRQAIHEGSETREPLSPRWRELYGARIDAVANAFKEKKIPLIWVGLPVTKAERFSADMAQFNEIYREHAARNGAVYIDIWEAFADERNQYQAFGPDINGQIVKLRSADGVHFTEAGSRKLAHFVEGEIRRLCDARPLAGFPANGQEGAPPPNDAQPQEAATPTFINPGAPAASSAPVLPERPPIGPAQPLNSTAAAGDGELARHGNSRQQTEAAAQAMRALANHIYIEGGDLPPRQGRADDFTWPRSNPAPQ
jgi:hypothetical protein